MGVVALKGDCARLQMLASCVISAYQRCGWPAPRACPQRQRARASGWGPRQWMLQIKVHLPSTSPALRVDASEKLRRTGHCWPAGSARKRKAVKTAHKG